MVLVKIGALFWEPFPGTLLRMSESWIPFRSPFRGPSATCQAPLPGNVFRDPFSRKGSWKTGAKTLEPKPLPIHKFFSAVQNLRCSWEKYWNISGDCWVIYIIILFLKIGVKAAIRHVPLMRHY